VKKHSFRVLEKRTAYPFLKATAREPQGMPTTSALSEQVFSHAGELYSGKRANLGVNDRTGLLVLRGLGFCLLYSLF